MKEQTKGINFRVTVGTLDTLRQISYVTDRSIQEIILEYVSKGMSKESKSEQYKIRLKGKGLRLAENDRRAAA